MSRKRSNPQTEERDVSRRRTIWALAAAAVLAMSVLAACGDDDDSGDVESVYALAKEAAAKAHRDRRPAFLNIKCCRYLEHVGIGTDWNWGYRDQATVEREWIARDALKVQRARLASHQVGESAIAAMEDEIEKAIQASVKRASQAPIPAPERLHAGVFHEKA